MFERLPGCWPPPHGPPRPGHRPAPGYAASGGAAPQLQDCLLPDLLPGHPGAVARQRLGRRLVETGHWQECHQLATARSWLLSKRQQHGPTMCLYCAASARAGGSPASYAAPTAAPIPARMGCGGSSRPAGPWLCQYREYPPLFVAGQEVEDGPVLSILQRMPVLCCQRAQYPQSRLRVA